MEYGYPIWESRKICNHPTSLPTTTLHDSLKKPTYTTTFSQFYPNGHDNQCKARQTPLRISIISTSPKSIPDKTFMDNHSTHINRWSKLAATHVQPSESAGTWATDETIMPNICIQLHFQCLSRRICQHWQHLPIIWTYHTNSNTTTQDWTSPG